MAYVFVLYVNVRTRYTKEVMLKNQIYNVKTQYRKLETIIPGKEIAWPHPNSLIHVSVSDLYVPTIGLPILLQENM
jgi:hypothetical protein